MFHKSPSDFEKNKLKEEYKTVKRRDVENRKREEVNNKKEEELKIKEKELDRKEAELREKAKRLEELEINLMSIKSTMESTANGGMNNGCNITNNSFTKEEPGRYNRDRSFSRGSMAIPKKKPSVIRRSFRDRESSVGSKLRYQFSKENFAPNKQITTKSYKLKQNMSGYIKYKSKHTPRNKNISQSKTDFRPPLSSQKMRRY